MTSWTNWPHGKGIKAPEHSTAPQYPSNYGHTYLSYLEDRHYVIEYSQRESRGFTYVGDHYWYRYSSFRDQCEHVSLRDQSREINGLEPEYPVADPKQKISPYYVDVGGKIFAYGPEGWRGETPIYGDLEDNSLRGGSKDDFIYGNAGNDAIFGDGGNDVLHGGGGNDKIYGGLGIDQIHGGLGNDEIFGGAGDDDISGGFGDDVIRGGDGDDRVCPRN